jgi:hypothetical protein
MARDPHKRFFGKKRIFPSLTSLNLSTGMGSTPEDYVEEFSKYVEGTGTNTYYVFSYPNTDDGHAAEKKFRKEFERPNLPGFGTGFREGGKILLVRINGEPEAYRAVLKHLGKPVYRAVIQARAQHVASFPKTSQTAPALPRSP